MTGVIRLAAFSATNVLGGFIIEVLGYANLSRYFPSENRLRFLYGDHPPYKATIVELCPQIEAGYPIGRRQIPLQAFSRKGLRHIQKSGGMAPEAEKAFEDGLRDTWMVLTPNTRGAAYLLWPMAKFRIPPAKEPQLHQQLLDLGVDPGKFIVTMHCREGVSRGDNSNIRNVDPFIYHDAARHIIEAQGGQVLRLGQPSAMDLPATEGLIDLSRVPDSLMLQAFAISRSRYALCAHSGLLHLAMAFQAPVGAADAVNRSALGPYPEAICLTKTYIRPDGREFRQAEALEAGLLDLKPDTLPEGYRLRDCTAEELVALADRLHDITAGVTGWREPKVDPIYSPNLDMFNALMASKEQGYRDFKFL
jgi:putative glycosyltransferase (TIGR04372 family)